MRLKRYISLCGLRPKYKKLLDGCHSVRSQVAALKKKLEDLGVDGQWKCCRLYISLLYVRYLELGVGISRHLALQFHFTGLRSNYKTFMDVFCYKECKERTTWSSKLNFQLLAFLH